MSGICFTAACVGCPTEVVMLALIGAVVVYALIGWLLSKLAEAIWENLDEALVVIIAIFWPIAVAIGVIVGVGTIVA